MSLHFNIPALSRKPSNLTVQQQLAYALPSMGIAFLMGPIGILQGIYAKHYGMPLTTIASVLLISRLFDAVSDPVIGRLSDRCHARTGSRKPLILCGGILFIVSSFFLYIPPDNVSTVYFLVCFLCFYLGFTLFEIPHLAWGGELSASPVEKNTIYGWRAAAIFFGTMLFYVVPLLPVFETNAFTPQVLQWEVFSASLLMLPLLFFSIRSLPDGRCSIDAHSRSTHNSKNILSVIVGNKPFLYFLVAFFLFGTAIGSWFAMLFIFVDSFLDFGEHFALISLLSLGSATLSIGAWHWLAIRIGKKLTWSLSMVLVGCGFLATGMLAPEETTFLSLLLIMILIYSGLAAAGILAPSLLSDIIDYGTLRFHVDCAATYFSIYTLIVKTNIALGGALGLAISGWYGFDPSAVTHSAENIIGLRLSIAWLPTPIVLVSILFIALIPMNPRRCIIIHRRLNARVERCDNAESNLFKPIKNRDVTQLVQTTSE